MATFDQLYKLFQSGVQPTGDLAKLMEQLTPILNYKPMAVGTEVSPGGSKEEQAAYQNYQLFQAVPNDAIKGDYGTNQIETVAAFDTPEGAAAREEIIKYYQDLIASKGDSFIQNYQTSYDNEKARLDTEAANIANIQADTSGFTPEAQAELDRRIAEYQKDIEGFNTNYGAFTDFGLEAYKSPYLKANEDGYIEQQNALGQPVSAALGAEEPTTNSNVGEATTIRQTADGKYEVVGAQSGQVFGSYNTEALALAGQNQATSGSTPTLTGAPGLYALDPTQGEKDQTYGQAYAPYTDPATGLQVNPQVATPDQMAAATAGKPIPNLNTPVQIRNAEELQKYAALGLSESDITRQGSAIYLNPGINEDSLRARGPSGTQVGSGQVTAGMGSLVPTSSQPGGFATTGPQAEQTASRIAALDQVAGTSLSAEGQLLGTIGQGIIDQDKALRELPETIRERTEDVGVTQGQLNRLIATEREPIAQALKDLLLSRSLLQEQIAFGREERAYQAEQMDNGYKRILASGMSADQIPDEYFAQLDSFNGVPAGTHEAMYNAERASSMAAQQAAQLDVASKVVGIMNDLPVGQSFTIGNQTYTGLNTGNLKVGTEEDANGNVTLWQYDPLTGQYGSKDLGNIGTGAGWETVVSNEGAFFRTNANTGQMQLMYDPNIPGSGISQTGGMFDSFTDGTDFGECGVFVREVTGLRMVDPNYAAKGIDPNSFESKMGVTDPSITAENAQVGDVFVSKSGVWTGHTGIITGITTDPNGETIFSVKDANWNKDGVVHDRQMKASEISGFARPGILPEYQWGTDSTGSQYTFGDQGDPADVQSLQKAFVSQSGTFTTVRDAYSKVQAAASSPSPAGDLALIFNYMKMLDPGSTVREGEFANAQNAGSIPTTIAAQYNKLLTDKGMLTTSQRTDFVTQAGAQYQSQYTSFKPILDYYTNEAVTQGIDPYRVVGSVYVPETITSTQTATTSSGSSGGLTTEKTSLLDSIFNFIF